VVRGTDREDALDQILRTDDPDADHCGAPLAGSVKIWSCPQFGTIAHCLRDPRQLLTPSDAVS
jgi:hypothetical protein